MTPQSVGLTGSQLTIGKLSGRRGLQGKLRELGHDVEGEALDTLYRQAIALADAKKEVTDADLLALVEQRASEVPASVELVGWSVTSSHGGKATGTRLAHRRGRGPDRRGDRQRPGRRALFGGRRGAPAGPRLAPGPRPSTRSRRSRPARTPRARSWSAAGARRTRARARSSCPATGCRRTSSRRRSRRTSWRSTSSTAPRSTASSVAFVGAANDRGAAVTRSRPTASPRSRATASGRTSSRRPGRSSTPPGARSASRSSGPRSLAGGAAIDAYGVAIRPEDVEAAGAADAILLGAVGGPAVGRPDGAASARSRRSSRSAAGSGCTPTSGRSPSIRRSCRRRRSGRSCSRASTC